MCGQKYTGFIATIAALVTVSAALAPLLESSASKIIDGEYIVVFKGEASTEEVGLHKKIVTTMLSNSSKIIHHYEIGNDFRGYSAKMSQEEVTKVRTLPNVKYVEKNQIAEISNIQATACMYQSQAPWGLVRTTWTTWPPTSYNYNYGSDGEGVEVFVIDTGIETTHPDFGGRAFWGVDLVQNPSAYTDQNGHGTHVAGTIIGNTYGVAKKATAIAVRVFDASGKGTTLPVLNGIHWVANNHNPSKATVVNMSLGSGAMTAIDDAVRATINKGVHFAVAAGNDNIDACNSSPARVTEAVTVGASDIYDRLASFSNFGQCVDIIGPGVDITSDWISGQINTISGTSMATPHVAGVMAKVLSKNPYYSPAQLKQNLLESTIPNKVSGITGFKWQTPNRLLYHSSCSS